MTGSRLTWVAYGVFVLTGLVLWLASARMESAPGQSLWLIMLGLVLSVVSIGFGIALTFVRLRARAGRVADILSGDRSRNDAPIPPSDRMPPL